jgi:hypothetical protein
MTTFKLIVKTIINTDKNIFSCNYYNSDKNNKIIKLLFASFISKEIKIKNKIYFYFETIQNTFLKSIIEEFIECFCKIQKTYNGFNKLAQLFKYKKAQIVVNHDIGLNEIKENDKNIILIVQCKTKYLFSINDLINIINTSLTNNYQFFPEPLSIKNPYNNIPFSKSCLYNIYLFILHKTYIRPDLFFKFFSCDFNLSIFVKKYEILLRETSINNYVYKSPSNLLFDEITQMIKYFNKYCKKTKLDNNIYIDVDFPKDKLIKIMQPYLLVYFTSLYSMIPNRKCECSYVFKQMMIKFNIFNPQFGRKRYKILFKHNAKFQKKIAGKIIEFDDKHVTFNKSNDITENFLKDHLIYNAGYNILNYFTNLLLIDEQHYFQNDEEDNEVDEEEGEEEDDEEGEEEDDEEGEEEDEEEGEEADSTS